MYAAVLFLGGTNTAAVQSVVAIERTVFYRERAAGMYSALPYAFAQVKENNWKRIIKKKTLILWFAAKIICIFIWCPAGGCRDNLCCYPNFCLHSYPLLNDWIPLATWKVLVVLHIYLDVLYVLHIVWDDGYSSDSWPPNCCHCYVLLRKLLEPVLWFPHPKASK